MNILILFLAGLAAGIIVSRFQRTDEQELSVDIIFGVMGATIIGGLAAQFIHLNPIILIIGIIGAFVFIEVGRSTSEIQ